jgi:hypothetical protein
MGFPDDPMGKSLHMFQLWCKPMSVILISFNGHAPHNDSAAAAASRFFHHDLQGVVNNYSGPAGFSRWP